MYVRMLRPPPRCHSRIRGSRPDTHEVEAALTVGLGDLLGDAIGADSAAAASAAAWDHD